MPIKQGRGGFKFELALLSRLGIKVRLSGFTLIEFVVVLGILSFVVGATMLFLNSVLRSANETNVTQEVKQNGQVVLDSLDKQIRNSIDAAGVGAPAADTSYSAVELTRQNEDPLYIKCLGSNATQNDRIGTAVSAGGVPADASYVSLSNDNRQNGVEIWNCKFFVTPSAISGGSQVPAVVAVQFTAYQGLDAPYRQDYKAQANFQTTISLRTY